MSKYKIYQAFKRKQEKIAQKSEYCTKIKQNRAKIAVFGGKLSHFFCGVGGFYPQI